MRTRMRAVVVVLAVTAPLYARPCESLISMRVPGMTITSARESPAGKLPAFCRVAAELRPTADSEIKIEVWLPPPDVWNGKYEAAGNGGWGGSLNNRGMSAALSRGYATSSTDTGHTGGRASFAMGHPQKLIDFGYRSIHLMTLAAKQMIAAFYGRGPKLSYFEGCSSGGRQALMEAQRFPEDYDGIIAGAPTNNWTRMMFGRIWVAQATLSDPAAYINPSQYPMIHRAALAACDALDGVKDEVLENPTHCHFDPGSLACKDAAGPGCLTKPQIEAARRIYTPATDPITGTEIFPPMERGSELVWKTLAGGPKPILLADDYFRYVAPIFRARRQIDSVSRLDRSASDAAQQHSLLRERCSPERESGDGRFVPPLYGARNESLPRRRRPGHVRHPERARTMAGARESPASDYSLTLDARGNRPHTAALPLSRSEPVQRPRQHGRRGQFFVHRALETLGRYWDQQRFARHRCQAIQSVHKIRSKRRRVPQMP